jgi:hypothetical protein
VVFLTKYRGGVLTGENLDTLGQVVARVGADFGLELVELDGQGDHVHLLVADPPQGAAARLVNSREGCLGSAAAPTLPDAHPHRMPVVAVACRGLGWWPETSGRTSASSALLAGGLTLG